jgi:hypothetical protein
MCYMGEWGGEKGKGGGIGMCIYTTAKIDI